MASLFGTRHTQRVNAGVPPQRYGQDGQEVHSMPQQKKTESATVQQQNEEEEMKSQSQKSVSIQSSTNRQLEIDDNTEDAIDDLESEFRSKERELKLMKVQKTHLQEEIRTMEAQLANPETMTEEEKAEMTTVLAKDKKTLQTLIFDIDRGGVEIDYQAQEMEKERRKLRRQAAKEKRQLEEDSEQQLDQLSMSQKNEATGRWAETTAGRPNDGRISPDPPDQVQDIPNETIPTASNRFQHSSSRVNQPVSSAQQQRVTWGSHTSSIPQRHRATTSHFAPSSNPISSTDKILARQVHGRDLPTFSGSPEEWPVFYNFYNNSTQFCHYSDAENLVRLQKCLKGEAKTLTQSLLACPENIPRVLEKLQMRFGRPDQIIGSMLAKVRTVVPVKLEKLETLVDFGMAVDNLTATIISLDCQDHLANPMLIEELVKKLPPNSQLEWALHLRYTQKDMFGATLDIFAEWLSNYTEAACHLCPFRPKTDETKYERKRKGQDDRVLAAAEQSNEEPSGNQSQKSGKWKSCHSCGRSGHRVESCHEFKRATTDDRWKTVKEKRLCFCCLNVGHAVGKCRLKRACGVDDCPKAHHKLLHSNRPAAAVPVNREAQPDDQHERVQFVREVPFINLLVLPVKLHGPNGVVSTYMMLDNGSTLSAIEEEVANQLGLNGEQTVVRVAGFQTEPMNLNSRLVSLKVSSLTDDFSHSLQNVKTVKNLNLRNQSVRSSMLKKWPHLRGIALETYENQKPGILIGSDNPSLMLQLEHRIGKGNAPVAIRTPLGWTLMGNTAWTNREQHSYTIRELIEDPLHQLVKDQFTTESFGVLPLFDKPRSREDKRAQVILDQTLKRVDGGWESGLLWRDDDVQLPQSRDMALKRLYSMERKMDRDSDFAAQYVQKIEEYKQKGFARALSPEEAMLETKKTFYLPHFMAYNPKKPGKLRFVFDAAASTRGSSLNQHLLQGPDKLTSLPGVLLKFRQRRIGFTADIQDMFHRVKVNKEDAQAQRFLWRGMDRQRDPDVWEMGVLIFGATCSPACAQEAKNRNALEFQETHPEAVEAILKRHYVDDYLDSCDTTDDGIGRFKDVRYIHTQGGFNLCNWLSSDRKMMSQIPQELRAKNMKDLNIGMESVVERVLGLFWKPESDEFTFSLTFIKARAEILEGKKTPTKREMLSLVMSIYDPLGFLAILTIKAKTILQKTWNAKIGWDDEIPSSLVEVWRQWTCYLQKIPTFSLRRCYSWNFSTAEDIQLHIL